MTRPLPEGREIGPHENDDAVDAMMGYIQAAAENVHEHGGLITEPANFHVLAAAQMQGMAIIHASESLCMVVETTGKRQCDILEGIMSVLQSQSSALYDLANAVNGLADATDRSYTASSLDNSVAPALSEIAGALAGGGKAVARAIKRHGQSVTDAAADIADAVAIGPQPDGPVTSPIMEHIVAGLAIDRARQAANDGSKGEVGADGGAGTGS
jgi:hypothetical protein